VVADRDQQVRLAQAHAAVDEQRVVGLAGRRLGDGHRRRVREAVRRAGDERVERVRREGQSRSAELALRRGRRRLRGRWSRRRQRHRDARCDLGRGVLGEIDDAAELLVDLEPDADGMAGRLRRSRPDQS
jgi:hypothetical protein